MPSGRGLKLTPWLRGFSKHNCALQTHQCSGNTRTKTTRHNLRNVIYAVQCNKRTRGKDAALQPDCSTEQRQLPQITTPPPHTCILSIPRHRKQSTSSIIKQGRRPLTHLISSVWVWHHVVPEEPHDGGMGHPSWRAFANGGTDRSKANRAFDESRYPSHTFIRAAQLQPTVPTMLKKDQPHI